MSKSPANLSQKDIIIVDDTPDNLRVLSSMLIAEGYRVRKALNGEMALTACSKSSPDLCLLDIIMPGMDGYEVCRRLKSDEKTRHIPVIFISALDAPFDKIKAFKAGGIDYITKPFQVEEVLARVENQLTIQQLQRNLTEQNARLEQLNEELLRSNADLEQFAFAASHDLQSPLSSILGYAGIINMKYKQSLDPDVERFVNNILDAGIRMKDLIQDLLSYSRVGTRSIEFEPTDCNVVLAEALANLREDIAHSGAEIVYPNMPKVIGNPTQLMQLFQNLISNAIKFRRLDVKPIVKILPETENEGQYLISIRDNGIGIEPHNFERIFTVFERLHSYKEYPGTGIGMALCKKIVERHGGRIWVDSEVGIGTTFYFTMPGVK